MGLKYDQDGTSPFDVNIHFGKVNLFDSTIIYRMLHDQHADAIEIVIVIQTKKPRS